MHPRLPHTSPASTPPPGWNPASWEPFLPALDRGDSRGLDVSRLVDEGVLVSTFSGALVPLPLLMNGIVLTHRLSAGEVAGGFVYLDPDLAPLFEPAQAGIPLAGGGEVRQATIAETAELGVDPTRIVLAGPAGWLDGLRPGGHLTVQWLGGRLHVGTAPVPRAGRHTVRALRATFEQMAARLKGDVPPAVTVRELVRELLLADPDRWTEAEPPLSEQLRLAGFATEHGWVGHPGTDLSCYAPQRQCPLSAKDLLALFPDGPCRKELEALERAVLQLRAGILESCAGPLPGLAALLGRHRMVEAFWLRSSDHAGFADLVAALIPHADGQARSSGHLLLARVAARDGNGGDLQRHLASAVEGQPCEPALTDAALMAELAGDVDSALALHRRAGETDVEAVARLQALAEAPPMSLPDRAPWLWEKARAVGLTPAGQQAWRQLAAAAPPGLDILFGGLAGFFTELLLFDLGGLQALLHLHGWRLPADERALATGWIGAPWRLWRVDGSDAHGVLALTDLVAGTSRGARLGPRHGGFALSDQFLGRVLDDGATSWVSYGTMPLCEETAHAAAHWVRDGRCGLALLEALDAALRTSGPTR